MPRLIDKLMQKRNLFPRDEDFSDMCAAQLICIDNIAQHYFVHSPRSVWACSDFPNVAPPFDNWFMEFRLPSSMNVGGTLTPTDSEWSGSEFGVLMAGLTHDSDLRAAISSQAERAGKKLNQKIEKWVLFGRVYVHNALRNRTIFPCVFYTFVDDDGSILTLDEGTFGLSAYFPGYEWIADMVFGSIISPTFLAISFLHCKNVTMENVEPPAPLSRKYQKKHGRPLEKYHVLNIEPMKKVLRTEGQSEKTGLKQALHICRGHFKDFSKGSGLFGKYRGLYWWDSQVRGSHTEGIIDKDYNVKTPRESK